MCVLPSVCRCVYHTSAWEVSVVCPFTVQYSSTDTGIHYEYARRLLHTPFQVHTLTVSCHTHSSLLYRYQIHPEIPNGKTKLVLRNRVLGFWEYPVLGMSAMSGVYKIRSRLKYRWWVKVTNQITPTNQGDDKVNASVSLQINFLNAGEGNIDLWTNDNASFSH